MDAVAESMGPISFDVDEWDENFINEVFQAELGLSSGNAAAANPPEPPPPENPSYSSRGDLNRPGFDAGVSDDCFSPPRVLSQRFPEKSDAALVANDCVTVETRVSRNAGYTRLGDGGRKDKEVERLKKELEHLTKKFTDMEQHCITLKKDRDQKNDQLKFSISQLEAKDAEIYSLKTEYLGASKQNQPHPSMSFENKGLFTNHVEAFDSKMKGLQTDGHAVSELKRRILIDDRVSTSCGAQECPFPESTKLKHRRAKGIQTDVGQDNIDIIQQRRMLNEHEISRNLHTIWGYMCSRKSGNNLVSKLLTTCSAEFCVLFGCINMSSKSNLDGEANESFSDMDLHDSTVSDQSSDAAKATRFYQLLMKMRHEMVSLQAIILQLLELCNLDDGTVAHASLRILHTTLRQHLSLWSSSQGRSNVFVGSFNDKRSTGGGEIKQEAEVPKFHGLQMTDTENEVFPISDSENLCLGENQDSSSIMFLPFESLVNVFETMQKIVLRNVEDIRLEGLSIMSLIMMESKPNSVREKFCSLNVLQTLSTLMSGEAGVHVRKQAVRLLFLLLNSPKMLRMLCGGQADGVDHAEVDDTQKSIATWQGEIRCVLENLAGCLTVSKSDTQELKLRRRVIILLAFVASSGKAGFEVLLTSVTSQQINFLGLIIQILAFEMDAEIPDNDATQDLCKERITLIREALILLNRLASHPTYSVATLQVLTGSKATTTLTVHVANRLLRRIQCWLKHYHGTKKTQVSTEINDLARLFRLRVFTFLGVPIS